MAHSRNINTAQLQQLEGTTAVKSRCDPSAGAGVWSSALNLHLLTLSTVNKVWHKLQEDQGEHVPHLLCVTQLLNTDWKCPTSGRTHRWPQVQTGGSRWKGRVLRYVFVEALQVVPLLGQRWVKVQVVSIRGQLKGAVLQLRQTDQTDRVRHVYMTVFDPAPSFINSTSTCWWDRSIKNNKSLHRNPYDKVQSLWLSSSHCDQIELLLWWHIKITHRTCSTPH